MFTMENVSRLMLSERIVKFKYTRISNREFYQIEILSVKKIKSHIKGQDI